MKLRTVKRWYYIALLLLVILAPIGRIWSLTIYCAVLICVMAPFLWLLFKYWRCPACGKMLGRMVIGNLVRCPHCKKEIDI